MQQARLHRDTGFGTAFCCCHGMHDDLRCVAATRADDGRRRYGELLLNTTTAPFGVVPGGRASA